jgi:hypothetical protein
MRAAVLAALVAAGALVLAAQCARADTLEPFPWVQSDEVYDEDDVRVSGGAGAAAAAAAATR